MFRQCSRSHPWVKLLLEILPAHKSRLEPCANHTIGLGSEIHEWMVPGENWIKIILRRSMLGHCAENLGDDRECIGESVVCISRQTCLEIPDGG